MSKPKYHSLNRKPMDRFWRLFLGSKILTRLHNRQLLVLFVGFSFPSLLLKSAFSTLCAFCVGRCRVLFLRFFVPPPLNYKNTSPHCSLSSVLSNFELYSSSILYDFNALSDCLIPRSGCLLYPQILRWCEQIPQRTDSTPFCGKSFNGMCCIPFSIIFSPTIVLGIFCEDHLFSQTIFRKVGDLHSWETATFKKTLQNVESTYMKYKNGLFLVSQGRIQSIARGALGTVRQVRSRLHDLPTPSICGYHGFSSHQRGVGHERRRLRWQIGTLPWSHQHGRLH